MKLRVLLYVLLAFLYASSLYALYGLDKPEAIIQEAGSIRFLSCQTVDCARVYIDYLAASRKAKCAFYDLGDHALLQSLQESTHVQVKIFAENHEADYAQHLQPVSSSGLMHHKFCVMDDAVTVTGSYNPTMRGGSVNDNYILIIHSPTIAAYHLKEYEQLGASKTVNPTPPVNLSGTLIDVCFSPQDSCEQEILEAISQAKHAIQFLAFSFTSDTIAQELLAAATRNVSVQGIYEKTRISRYSTYHTLQEANISVYLDGNSATMHEKLFLIDAHTIIAGSYNPTASAQERNDENLLIITDLALAGQASTEYKRVAKGLKTEPI